MYFYALPALPAKHQYKSDFMLRPIAEVVASQQAMTTRLGRKAANLDPNNWIATPCAP